ncbi:MAG: flavodoxin [Bacteroidetes bacterium]|nr:flavodoxin [Bacteroidota bacterium]
MAKIGIFYGSSTGNTEFAARKIAMQFGEGKADVYNVDSADASDIEKYPYLIFGTSTWGIGDMQDDWEDFIEVVESVDLKGKKAAIFGVGDQDTYPDSFVDGMGTLYKRLKDKVEFAGEWPTDGYDFDHSDAVIKDKFVGLSLDVDNQDELTQERIEQWVKILMKEFK